jgi:hypothetical protein
MERKSNSVEHIASYLKQAHGIEVSAEHIQDALCLLGR